jgi:hypothetical protein
LGKFSQRFLGQHRVAILPDRLDFSVLKPKHQAIIVVVALACLGEIIAARLDHDVIAIGDETMGNSAGPFHQQRPHMGMKIV